MIRHICEDFAKKKVEIQFLTKKNLTRFFQIVWKKKFFCLNFLVCFLKKNKKNSACLGANGILIRHDACHWQFSGVVLFLICFFFAKKKENHFRTRFFINVIFINCIYKSTMVHCSNRYFFFAFFFKKLNVFRCGLTNGNYSKMKQQFWQKLVIL